jgi:hypothetical protein
VLYLPSIMEKLNRSIFLYSQPSLDYVAPLDEYAQCSTCSRLCGPLMNTCSVLGPQPLITEPPRMSCNVYAYGPQVDEVPERASFTKEEVGFVHRLVRCENCFYGGYMGGRCGNYVMLNRLLPSIYDLDETISPHGCCTQQTPTVSRARAAEATPRKSKYRFKLSS